MLRRTIKMLRLLVQQNLNLPALTHAAVSNIAPAIVSEASVAGQRAKGLGGRDTTGLGSG